MQWKSKAGLPISTALVPGPCVQGHEGEGSSEHDGEPGAEGPARPAGSGTCVGLWEDARLTRSKRGRPLTRPSALASGGTGPSHVHARDASSALSISELLGDVRSEPWEILSDKFVCTWRGAIALFECRLSGSLPSPRMVQASLKRNGWPCPQKSQSRREKTWRHRVGRKSVPGLSLLPQPQSVPSANPNRNPTQFPIINKHVHSCPASWING